MVAKVSRMDGGSLEGITVAVLGLTFKANTDDLRGSPALEISHRMNTRGALLRGYDPAVHAAVEGVEVFDSAYSAVEGADIAVVLTEWDEFRWLDWDKMAELMKSACVVDARNLLDPALLRRCGFQYEGLVRI